MLSFSNAVTRWSGARLGSASLSSATRGCLPACRWMWSRMGTNDGKKAAPEALFQEADELYLMAYGDGDSTEGGDAPTSLPARIAGAYGFSGAGRTHVVLATYEFPSQNRLQAELKKVRRALASRPNFAGTAVFHANSSYQATARGGSAMPPAGNR